MWWRLLENMQGRIFSLPRPVLYYDPVRVAEKKGSLTVYARSQLLQQQAPEKVRGSVIGLFGICGGIGIMLCLKVGGYLFDNVSYAGPFIFVGLLNFVVLVWALIVRGRVRARSQNTELA